MRITVDVGKVREELNGRRISPRSLTEHYGVKRKDSDIIRNSEWAFDELSVAAIMTLSEVLDLNIESLIGSDGIADLSNSVAPLVLESENSVRLQLIRFKETPEVFEEYERGWSLSRTLRGINADDPDFRRKNAEKQIFQEILGTTFHEEDLTTGPDVKSTLTKVRTKWLSKSSVDSRTILADQEHLRSIEELITKGTSARRWGAADTLGGILAQAERAQEFDPANIALESDKLRIFYHQDRRPLIWSETYYEEVWDQRFHDEATTNILKKYQGLYQPWLTTNYFIIAEPEDDFLLLQLDKHDEEHWGVDVGMPWEGVVSPDLWEKFGEFKDAD